jgi:uncharacterized iron-regulated membrane protein
MHQTKPKPLRQGLFRAFWRWHFYGAMIVVPVLLVLATTGLIYLFRFQIEPLMNGDLMRVDHAQGQLTQPYETQLEMVAKAYPDVTVVSMTEPENPDATTRFTVTTAADETRDVFVDPYRLKVLGDLNPDTTLSGYAVRIHSDLMAGRVGEVVMELGACWAIVMALTGYFLYVRGARARRRQRQAGAAAAALRTNHARVGLFVGGFVLLLVVSGLPWTGIWGKQAQQLATNTGASLWSDDPGALSDPTSTLDESLPHSHHVVPWAQEKTPVPQSNSSGGANDGSVASIDTAVAAGEREGLARPMTIALPSDDKGVYSAIGYAFTDPGQERTVHVDRFGGQVVGRYGYAEYGALAKVVSQGIALHEGRRFGLLNLVLTTLLCVGVIVSCVTGPLLWWRRRPRGSGELGAPRGRMPLGSSPLLAALVVGLGMFLPVFGASLLVALLVDRFVVRRQARVGRFLGAMD